MTTPKVAYFSMEMAIDQSLYTYAGGLGYLAGSHMLSARYLKMPMVGVTILWHYGYGDQVINGENEVEIHYSLREYPWLEDTGIVVEVSIFGRPVKVKAFKLPPEKFGTVPIYLLSTNLPENSPEDRELTGKLYDADQKTRISQEIILGIGGLRVLKAAHEPFQLIHLNEGHALPAAFEHLNDMGGDIQKLREHLVFTTHTPVAAGNESHPAELLAEAGFFAGIPIEQAIELGGHDFCLTVAALRMSRLSNAVSQLHGHVANNMWSWVHDRCPIMAITNAVDLRHWQARTIHGELDSKQLHSAKREMKAKLFKYVAEKTGKVFDPDVLTIVWARRFTEYKRAGLIFSDEARLRRLLEEKKIQLLFAGKFHPNDTSGRDIFNRVLKYAQELPNLAILTGYELELSAMLKRGADVWLNTPMRPMEASGTSGMSANMNGALHMSIPDGWAVEGTFHETNGFLINENGTDAYTVPEERNEQDYQSMMGLIENTLIPTYYQQKERWAELMRNAIHTAESYFHSDRMVVEYYSRLYKPIFL